MGGAGGGRGLVETGGVQKYAGETVAIGYVKADKLYKSYISKHSYDFCLTM